MSGGFVDGGLKKWEVEWAENDAAWESGGKIGPSPNHRNPPSSAYVKRFYDHDRWLRTGGRVGERLVFQNKNFNHTDLDGANLSGAIFANVAFFHASLRETSFKGAKFLGVSFVNCDLDRTDFTGAAGQQVEFTGPAVEKANFGEGRTGIEEESPDRSQFRLVGHAKRKYDFP